MIPLKTNRQVLTWLCVCRPPKTTSEWKKRIFIVFGTAVFVSNIASLILDIIFLSKTIKVDLGESYYIMFQIGASSNRTNALIIGIFIRGKINALFDNLTDIYDARKICDLEKK